MQPRFPLLAARGIALIAAAVVVAMPAALASAQDPSPAPEWQPVYNRLVGEIMSPFCQGLTLENCPTSGAAEMRNQIRAWLIEGKDQTWIEDQLVAQYGPSVLGAPRMSGWGLLAWVTPPLALFLGAVGVAGFLRRRRTDPGEEQAAPAAQTARVDDDDLADIERRVELEIGDWAS